MSMITNTSNNTTTTTNTTHLSSLDSIEREGVRKQQQQQQQQKQEGKMLAPTSYTGIGGASQSGIANPLDRPGVNKRGLDGSVYNLDDAVGLGQSWSANEVNDQINVNVIATSHDLIPDGVRTLPEYALVFGKNAYDEDERAAEIERKEFTLGGPVFRSIDRLIVVTIEQLDYILHYEACNGKVRSIEDIRKEWRVLGLNVSAPVRNKYESQGEREISFERVIVIRPVFAGLMLNIFGSSVSGLVNRSLFVVLHEREMKKNEEIRYVLNSNDEGDVKPLGAMTKSGKELKYIPQWKAVFSNNMRIPDREHMQYPKCHNNNGTDVRMHDTYYQFLGHCVANYNFEPSIQTEPPEPTNMVTTSRMGTIRVAFDISFMAN